MTSLTDHVDEEPARMADSRAGPRPSGDTSSVAVLVGLVAVAFSAIYLFSDLLELVHGGFSTSQLVLTYAAEAAIPLFVLGLYGVQRPRIGRLGLTSAVLYAYTFVYFTGTVVYALVEGTSDWPALERRLGMWITIHSALMIVAGIGFGIAVIRARVLPWWTGATLIAGMLLMVSTLSLPAAAQTASAAVRDLGFMAMGAVLLVRGGRHRRGQPHRRADAKGFADHRGPRSGLPAERL
ncbi:hypothetical protein ACQP2Y_32805 [Actinoplanes sp. CA-051413]|uniref:hypothetical protein n=1 Tax=Actinoplanes sp. CA-051413 TaxID=3239899 RepID=UPI003D95830F